MRLSEWRRHDTNVYAHFADYTIVIGACVFLVAPHTTYPSLKWFSAPRWCVVRRIACVQSTFLWTYAAFASLRRRAHFTRKLGVKVIKYVPNGMPKVDKWRVYVCVWWNTVGRANMILRDDRIYFLIILKNNALFVWIINLIWTTDKYIFISQPNFPHPFVSVQKQLAQ